MDTQEFQKFFRFDKTKMRRVKKEENTAREDVLFWRSQLPEYRIAAVEFIRQEYHGYTNDTAPRMQKVISKIKKTDANN